MRLRIHLLLVALAVAVATAAAEDASIELEYGSEKMLDSGGLIAEAGEGSGDADDTDIEPASTISDQQQPVVTQPTSTAQGTVTVDELADTHAGTTANPELKAFPSHASALDKPSSRMQEPTSAQGRWSAGNWSDCSTSCGEGLRHRSVLCVNEQSAPVGDAACSGLETPSTTQTCWLAACQPLWYHTDWGVCTGTCGLQGVQQRFVFCAREEGEEGGRMPRLLPDARCHEFGLSRPAMEQPCTVADCPQWHASNWSLCNSICGRGERTRKVVCRQTHDGRLLDDEACSKVPRPAELETCEAAACGGVDWVMSDWSECIGGCHGVRGFQTRRVVCSGASGHAFDDDVCNPATRPVSVKVCFTPASQCSAAAGVKPKFEWFTSDWSACSASCGTGQQTRSVVCVSHLPGGDRQVVSDRECSADALRSIVVHRDCITPKPCPAAWHTSRFSDCLWDESKQTASLMRHAFCLPSRFNVLPTDGDCPVSMRPYTSEPCDGQAEKDYRMLHEQCSAGAFGCCADGITKALGPAYQGCPQRDNAIDCHKSVFGCCPDGTSMAIGPFYLGCPVVQSCKDTRYGCCGDGVTPAAGDSHSGADLCNSVSPCFEAEWGCCDDQKTAAQGPGFTGCPVASAVHMATVANDVNKSCVGDNCEARPLPTDTACGQTRYGCCPDGVSPAASSTGAGCEPLSTSATPSGTEAAVIEEVVRPVKACITGDAEQAVACGKAAQHVNAASGVTTPRADEDDDNGGASPQPVEETIIVAEAQATLGAPVTKSEIDNDDDEDSDSTDRPASTTAEVAAAEVTVAPVDPASGADSSDASTVAAQATVTAPAVTSTTGAARLARVCHAPTDLVASAEPNQDEATLVNVSWRPPASQLPASAQLSYTVYYSEVPSEPLDEWDQMTTNETSVQIALDPNTTYYFKASAKIVGSESGGPTSFTYKYTTTEDKGMVLQGGCHATQYGCCSDGLTAATGPRQNGCLVASSMDAAAAAAAQKQVTSQPPEHIESAPRDFAATGLSLNDIGILTRLSWQPPAPGAIVVDYYVLYYVDDDKRPLPEWQTVVLSETSVSATFPRGITVYFRIRAHNAVSDGPLSSIYQFVAEEGSECRALLPSSCTDSPHGCCADGVTSAAGPASLGCSDIVSATSAAEKAEESGHRTSPAATTDQEPASTTTDATTSTATSTAATTAAAVATTRHQSMLVGGCRGTRWGCCSDGRTSAHGPDRLGCIGDPQPCDVSPFGCCLDGSSHASGPDFQGCAAVVVTKSADHDCSRSFYGCCSDGKTPATGESMAGCPDQVSRGDICSLSWDVGPDSNYTVKWYFDLLNGVCRRFWYGGRGGNDNRFDDEKACKNSCVHPNGTDTCFLPPSTGRCKGVESKWYYDPRAGSCRRFTYGGCFGNMNNFASQQACDKTCRLPLRKDTCSLPKITGPCRGSFRRWHYDASSGTCDEFTYGGCGGNSNRFTTPEDCHKRCIDRDAKDICTLPIDQGPCHASITKWAFDVKAGSCRQFYYGGCRGNANSFDTQDECSVACSHRKLTMRDVCRMEPDAGSCSGNRTQYYYDHRLGTCRTFIYGGCDGNSNRFGTHEECMKSCRRHLADSEFSVESCHRVPITNGACPASAAVSPAHRGSEAMKVYYTYDAEDGLCKQLPPGICNGTASDNVFESGEACEHACAAQYDNVAADDDICKLPTDSGQCATQSTRIRWSFNSADGVCRSFLYTGCHGNRNNFLTEDACIRRCSHRTTLPEDVCTLPRDTGLCHASFPRYYFDHEAGVCRQFNYSGCGGNANRFSIAEDCTTLCAPRGLASTRGLAAVAAVTDHDMCTMPAEPGPCRAAIPRWFFDPEAHECTPFTYGGCRGNGNNFYSRSECAKRCQMRDPAHLDVCSLPAAPGPCLMRLPRWYFDEAEHKCQPFTYGGCQGNGNRFASEAQCSSRCAETDNGVLTVALPAEPASETKAATGQAVSSQTSDATTTGVVTAAAAAAATTSEQAVHRADDVCELPLEQGACAEEVQSEAAPSLRFYYDRATRLCRPFRFLGCGGNGNSFTSMSACEAACHSPSVTEATEQPGLLTRRDCFDAADVGQCSSSLARYYFDAKRGVCEMFYYGGCGGNRNNFLSADDCSAFCLTETRLCPKLECPPETRDIRRCPHGIAYDGSGCPTCDCLDPCSGVTCPPGSRCLARDPQCPDFDSAACQKSEPICMPVVKEGQCPQQNDSVAFESCGEYPTCADDASCGGDDKCCESDACGLVCVGLATAQGLSRSNSEACVTSEYGCCLDGLTPARGYGYKGCPERRPRIMRPSGHGSQYVAAVGELVRLPCIAIGSPAPRIDWYKNRKPIRLASEPRLTLLDNGTLIIAPLTVEDNAEYICRAYNGIGDPAYEYLTIQVRDHVMIVDSSAAVVAARGTEVRLWCKASGSPTPTITWMFDGKPVVYGQESDGSSGRAGAYARGSDASLVITSLSESAEGDYVCYAQNTVNSASKVIAVGIEEPLSAQLSSYSSTVVTGADLELQCDVKGYPPPKVSWMLNGESLPYDDRIVINGSALSISDVRESDAGNYSCLADNGKDIVDVVAVVIVLPPPTTVATTTKAPGILVPASCQDRPLLANCSLIVRYNYCSHPMYRQFCCRSCFLSGKLGFNPARR